MDSHSLTLLNCPSSAGLETWALTSGGRKEVELEGPKDPRQGGCQDPRYWGSRIELPSFMGGLGGRVQGSDMVVMAGTMVGSFWLPLSTHFGPTKQNLD